MRAGLVVVGAVAFGYLSFQVGFKPYLERAQEAMDRLQQGHPSDGDNPTSPPAWPGHSKYLANVLQHVNIPARIHNKNTRLLSMITCSIGAFCLDSTTI
ncbi:hypothetical protein MUK42_34376 [Musa troglodytarum]|uniref:Uncharacterized protein n=1 Tax=Musa troglodytarum TaxID=320322 RepID=A0A9E7HU25_9LILI|nr:hypothetical protein MUK42_34376 [Musa troglodytarum]